MMNMIVLMVFALAYLAILAWLVISQGPQFAENRSLFVTILIVGLWLATVFGLQAEIGADVLYARMVFVVGLMSAFSVTQYVGFITLSHSKAIKLLCGLSLIWLTVSLITLSTELVISSVTVEVVGTLPIPTYGSMIHVYNASLAIAVCIVTFLVMRGVLYGSRKTIQQMRVVGFSILISMTIAVVTNYILPVITKSSESALLSPVAILVLISGLNYSIIRQGLFDVRLAAVRTSSYLLSISALAIVYFTLAQVISVLVFGNISMFQGSDIGQLNIALAFILAFIFQPVKGFFDQLTHKLFYRGQYDKETFFKEFGRILSFDTDLKLLLSRASAYIAKSLNAERVFFYISEKGTFSAAGASNLQMPRVDIEAIAEYYRKNHEAPAIIVTDRVTSAQVKRILLSHQASIVMPLMLQGVVVGCLFMGEHKSRGYSARDYQVLESISNELTIAVRNSLSVEEIRELNETLQRRVDDATKELRASNHQLQRLDEAKNEFISMASHQLRTPLTSIKGYLDMVLQGDLGNVTSTQKTVLSEAFSSSERMVQLINDFLNVSRLQTGKFVIDRRSTDLAKIVREEVSLLRIVAAQRQLTLDVEIAQNLPQLNVDGEKLRQVVLNMIDNAIYYSPPDSVVHIKLKQKPRSIEFTVRDSGIGVPLKEQVGLFGKFFRASNARKRRPDGTGVGLFLAKKVIMAHDGEILFSSEEGKGSTFGFCLPSSQSVTEF